MFLNNKNGAKVFYQTSGQGDAVLLLHHGFGSTGMWDRIGQNLAVNGYRCIAYDRRGYGQSERGEGFDEFYTGGRYRSESVAELETLRTELGVESMHIVGQCEGGIVGLDYAIHYPQRTRSVTISSSLCFSRVTVEEFNKTHFPDLFAQKGDRYREKFFAWHGRAKAEFLYNLFRVYGGAYGKGFFDFRPELPGVKCPTLILYPDRSSLFEVEQGVAFYRHIENSELAVIPKCGHNTYEHQPQEYLRQVLRFLDRLNRPPGDRR